MLVPVNFVDILEIIRTTAEIEALTETVKDSDVVYFCSSIQWLFAAWWREDVKGICTTQKIYILLCIFF
jgi:glycerol kinase